MKSLHDKLVKKSQLALSGDQNLRIGINIRAIRQSLRLEWQSYCLIQSSFAFRSIVNLKQHDISASCGRGILQSISRQCSLRDMHNADCRLFVWIRNKPSCAFKLVVQDCREMIVVDSLQVLWFG